MESVTTPPKNQAFRALGRAIAHRPPRPDSGIYRARPVLAELVKASLIACGGTVAEQDAPPRRPIAGGRP